MNRIDFGKLVASLRKEHQDEEGAPWTQCELAKRANSAAGVQLFSEDIISFIERGKRSLDRRILLALATALQLTSDERKEFFLAASGIDTQEIACQEAPPKEVFPQMLENIRMLYLPAAVLDAYCDVLAVNYVLLELLDFPSAYGLVPGARHDNPYEYNLLHFIFSESGSEHFIKLMGDGFSNFAYTAVSFFRSFSLAYRSTDYFHSLLDELRKSRLFKRYWSEIYFREKERQFGNADIRVHSPRWGTLLLNITTKTTYSTAGELHLAAFVPADQKTANICGQILQQTDVPTIFCLTPWPNKNIPD